MGRPIGVEKKAEILGLLAEGHTCSEIGRRVGVGRHTVQKYVDAEVARVAAEEEVVAEADAEKLAAKVPAAQLSENELEGLRWLATQVGYVRCDCGASLPYFAYLLDKVSITCGGCQRVWTVAG